MNESCLGWVLWHVSHPLEFNQCSQPKSNLNIFSCFSFCVLSKLEPSALEKESPKNNVLTFEEKNDAVPNYYMLSTWLSHSQKVAIIKWHEWWHASLTRARGLKAFFPQCTVEFFPSICFIPKHLVFNASLPKTAKTLMNFRCFYIKLMALRSNINLVAEKSTNYESFASLSSVKLNSECFGMKENFSDLFSKYSFHPETSSV